MGSYRQVGGRLGAYIRANNPSTQQIQGLLADLLAGDELLPIMRDVVSRPSFAPIKVLAGSGAGRIQLDALLQDLGRSYLPKIIDSIDKLISGALDIPERFAKNSRSLSLGPSFNRAATPATGISASVYNERPRETWNDQSLLLNEPGPSHLKPRPTGKAITSHADRQGQCSPDQIGKPPEGSLSRFKLALLFLPMTALLAFILFQTNYLEPSLKRKVQQRIQETFQEGKGRLTVNASSLSTAQMTTPIKVGMEYPAARARLIDAGWQPHMPPGVNILSCDSQLRTCGAGRRPIITDMEIQGEKETRQQFRERGFYETIDCRVTGTGSCMQYFTDAKGDGLIVETTSGSLDPRLGGGETPIVLGFRLTSDVSW